MIKIAYSNFIRSNGVRIGLIFIITAGIVSLLVGKQFSHKTKKDISEAAQHQQEHFKRNTEYFKDEIGLMLYYVKFAIVNHAPALSSLSIGQRDINSTLKSLNIRGLEAQKYDAELHNPYNLLIGNIDFSFVLIYLFPLLIIAFSYNIISEEKETGTWKIVLAQSQNPLNLIVKLFGIRLAIVLGVFAILMPLAIVFLDIPFDKNLFAFVAVAVLYILFWFGVSFWGASLHKSSNVNAVVLLSIWIGLLLILPATINNYLVNKYPVPEAFDTTVKQRKGYHEKFEMDKSTTMGKFFAHYPQFKKYTLPDKDFSWQWYYAMQQVGDDAAADQAQKFSEKLRQRENASKRISQFIPTLHTQIQLNEIAQSGLGNQLRYLEETNTFHEKLRLYFYPKIFEEAASNKEDWRKFEVETFKETPVIDWLKLMTPFVFYILLLATITHVNFKKMGV
jgi:ABC-2 type transport system permease protein